MSLRTSAFALFLLVAAFSGAWLAFALGDRVQVLVITAPPDSGEVAGLKGQLEATQQANDQMVEIMSTSIQVVVVLAFALAAFSWFTNNKVYERDIASIRREAQELMTTAEQRVMLTVQKQFEDVKIQTGAKAKAAAQSAHDDLREELLSLKDAFWGAKHEDYEKEGREAFAVKHGSRAFDAYLRAFEALTRHRESGWGGAYAPFADPIEELEKIVRELNYRPDVEQLSRLEAFLGHSEIPVQLKPAIDRLRKALDSVKM